MPSISWAFVQGSVTTLGNFRAFFGWRRLDIFLAFLGVATLSIFSAFFGVTMLGGAFLGTLWCLMRAWQAT
jgi:hypothetical protein